MRVSRRMRLIWHKLEVIPVVGVTADVITSEAMRFAGAKVPIPWLFTAISVGVMLFAALIRSLSIPRIPESLGTPDPSLTRRSRILTERLGADSVRVFVADMPRRRGHCDTFIVGDDLFVSQRVAALPEEQGDYLLARALVVRDPVGRFHRRCVRGYEVFLAVTAMVLLPLLTIACGPEFDSWWVVFIFISLSMDSWPMILLARKRYGPEEDRTDIVRAVRATGNLAAAIEALEAFAETTSQKKDAATETEALKTWWNSKGQKAVEASEWYLRANR